MSEKDKQNFSPEELTAARSFGGSVKQLPADVLAEEDAVSSELSGSGEVDDSPVITVTRGRDLYTPEGVDLTSAHSHLNRKQQLIAGGLNMAYEYLKREKPEIAALMEGFGIDVPATLQALLFAKRTGSNNEVVVDGKSSVATHAELMDIVSDVSEGLAVAERTGDPDDNIFVGTGDPSTTAEDDTSFNLYAVQRAASILPGGIKDLMYLRYALKHLSNAAFERCLEKGWNRSIHELHDEIADKAVRVRWVFD